MIRLETLRKATAGLLLAGGMAQAALPIEEAARLGIELTPLGGDPQGNAAGTIPAWNGGLSTPPPGYKTGSGIYVNPFADEKPLYVITASNMSRYEQHLSEGTKALLKRFPNTYKIPVYPTHRTAAFPQHVYEDIKRDAQRVELINGGEGIKNVGKGRIPFPIPRTGLEAITNLAHTYFGDDIVMHYSNFPVQANGSYTEVKVMEWRAWAPVMEGNEQFGSKFFYQMFSPASVAGTNIVSHVPFDYTTLDLQTWVYNPGQRRVLRAPEVSYDTPMAGTDGLVTSDADRCFSGGKDRYNWTLKGKKELIVPYNNYDLNYPGKRSSEIVGPQHINPQLMRYELHRVWVVEADLKSGKRHVISKRRYYLDEDSWLCVGAEFYDGRGELWRVIVPTNVQMYDIPMLLPHIEAHYDLHARRYYVGYVPNESGPWTVGNNAKSSDFSIAKLRRSGR